MTRLKWNEQETNYLLEIAQTDEIDEVCKRYNKMAKLEGWMQRTNDAIKAKLKRAKISYRPIDGGWTCTTLAEILGITRDRVHHLVYKGFLKSSREPGKRHHRILERNFIAFAKDHPQHLMRVSEERLSILLPHSIVKAIVSQPHKMPGFAIPVYSARTGRRYKSIKAAARQEFIDRSTITACVLSGAKTKEGDRFITIAKS
jgi:hypothetical protein